MATTDLWPSDLKNTIQSDGPSLILKQQAQLLSKKTDGLVEAYVAEDIIPGTGKPSYFVDRFVLFSPSLNYRYPLFSISYSAQLYPALIEWWGYTNQSITDERGNDDVRDGVKQVFTREDLEKELQRIFAAPATVQVIGNLISRARS